jgi:YVTN family beta-propeller protein
VYGSVATTLDLVDNRTLPGATQPISQDTPLSVVDDPANGDLYVRGYTGQSLTVVNGTTNTAIAEIAVPYSQNPSVLTPQTVDPVGRWVYVANDGASSNITIINGTTNVVSGSISLSGSPNAIVDDPTQELLYVPIFLSNEVAVVDTTTNSVLKYIPVGSHPNAILFDPTSDQVFVANWGSANVTVLSTTSNTVVTNIATGSYPVALALDTHDDKVDVANSYNGNPGTVTVISAPALSTTHGGVNISVGRDPDALAYAPSQNRLFVANAGTNNVSVLNGSRLAATVTVQALPTGS